MSEKEMLCLVTGLATVCLVIFMQKNAIVNACSEMFSSTKDSMFRGSASNQAPCHRAMKATLSDKTTEGATVPTFMDDAFQAIDEEGMNSHLGLAADSQTGTTKST